MRLSDFCVTPTKYFFYDHANKLKIPIFDIVYLSPDNATVDRYLFLKVLYAASDNETIENAVAMYCCDANKRVVVLKTIPSTETEELDVVHEFSRASSLTSPLDADQSLENSDRNDSPPKRPRRDFNDNGTDKKCARIVPARVAYKAPQSSKDASEAPKTPADFNAILMPYAGTQLRHAQRSMTQEEVIDVVLRVARSCKVLMSEGWAYVDLKASNVVLDSEKRPTIVDYGSIYKLGCTYACATYPPPSRPHGTGVSASEASMVYGLGVLLASLVQSFECERGFRFVHADKTLPDKCRREAHRKAAEGLRRAASELIENAVTPALREVYLRSVIVPSTLEEFICKLENICVNEAE